MLIIDLFSGCLFIDDYGLDLREKDGKRLNYYNGDIVVSSLRDAVAWVEYCMVGLYTFNNNSLFKYFRPFI